MNGEEKCKLIQSWVEQDNRVTVDFWDEWGLVATVTACTEDAVELKFETGSLESQLIAVPLNQIRIGEDSQPSGPLSSYSSRRSRLRLTADRDRPRPAPLTRSR
jgi:hypothetical protein